MTTAATRTGATRVEAVDGRAPSDELLRAAWDYVSDKPGKVQTVLAAIGPALRQPVLERLIARGDFGEESRKTLGLFKTKALVAGEMGGAPTSSMTFARSWSTVQSRPRGLPHWRG
ncbi:hypothetical protein brsh051_24980 [Brooklawnia propionicigenes]|uniref:Uncharacterized protein n=1 Tax=Brooklawnia propionicigenes TaxID=3041175 RepID=A0AAN0KB81_9ACTN|nr:hypothetical protein brsh051_24980 [Brooklawnia sp. SH051]